MMKKMMLFTAFSAAICLTASPVFAQGKTGQAGKSNTAHLYLMEKDPVSWTIVKGGAFGKMRYKLAATMFDYVFNGHLLVPGTNYTLIYYPDPWPGSGLICLGNGMSDDEGDVHIKAAVDTGDLPAEADANSGAKIWLVLSEDVNCNVGESQMIGWNPTQYLFESDLITFDDTEQ